MFGRNKTVVDTATGAASSTLSDLQAGARAGAVKGAAMGALSVLGNKAASAAHSASDSKRMSRLAGTAGKKADKARKSAAQTVGGSSAASLLQRLGKNAGDAAQGATDGSGIDLKDIRIDPNDVPRMLRGLTLVATGLGTLLAPGSALDVSDSEMDERTIAAQARGGIDQVTDLAQQRIKDLVDIAKETLTSLSDAITESVQEAEQKAEQALDETESRLLSASESAADQAKGAVPARRGGGTMRWLLLGALAGSAAAYLASPWSGPIGERINSLRRDLGLGGDDESQYWPSASTSEAAGDTTTNSAATSTPPPTEFSKAETWKNSDTTKESSDKS